MESFRHTGRKKTNTENCDALPADVEVAEESFGPGIVAPNGKSERQEPKRVEADTMETAKELEAQQKELKTIVQFRSLGSMESGTNESEWKTLDKNHRHLDAAGFSVTSRYCNSEFKSIMNAIIRKSWMLTRI